VALKINVTQYHGRVEENACCCDLRKDIVLICSGHWLSVITVIFLACIHIHTGCGFKNDPTPKLWLLSNAWKFLHQILYACLAVFSSLMGYFCLKLLYVYETGVTPNFKFEFANAHHYYYLMLHFEQLFSHLLEKHGCWALKIDT